jgi:hypothetical protein
MRPEGTGISRGSGAASCFRCGRGIDRGAPTLDLDLENDACAHAHLECARFPEEERRALARAIASCASEEAPTVVVSERFSITPIGSIQARNGVVLGGGGPGNAFDVPVTGEGDAARLFYFSFTNLFGVECELAAIGARLSPAPTVRWSVHYTLGVDGGQYGVWTPDIHDEVLELASANPFWHIARPSGSVYLANTMRGDGVWPTLLGRDASGAASVFVLGDSVDFLLAAALGVDTDLLGTPCARCG